MISLSKLDFFVEAPQGQCFVLGVAVGVGLHALAFFLSFMTPNDAHLAPCLGSLAVTARKRDQTTGWIWVVPKKNRVFRCVVLLVFCAPCVSL